MTFVSTYNSASVRGWTSGNPVGARLALDYDLTSPTIANNVQFGSYISTSSDGGTISIGASGTGNSVLVQYPSATSANIDSPHINGLGTVWIGQIPANIGNINNVDAIQVRTSSTGWSVTQTLYPSVYYGNDNFGSINTIDGSGNIIISLSKENATPFKYMFVYVKSGNTYTETQRITLSGPVYPRLTQNFPVSLSYDANILAVGCSFTGSLGVIGYVDIYNKTGNTYTYQTRVSSLDTSADDGFGSSTSLNSDGSLMLVGAENISTNTGAAYLFQRTGNSWTQVQKITSPKASTGDQFGSCVSISADSSIAAIGAIYEDTGGNNRGSSFIYFNVNSRFYYSQELTGTANLDGFGYSVATSNQPDYITAVGAFGADYSGKTNVGKAYVYSSVET